MIPPCVYTIVCNALRYRDVFGSGVVCDTEICRSVREVVEGCGGVGFYPGDGERGAVFLLRLVVDKGVGEGSEEAGLACPACGNSELNRCCGGISRTVVYICWLDFAGVFPSGSVEVGGCHGGKAEKEMDDDEDGDGKG